MNTPPKLTPADLERFSRGIERWALVRRLGERFAHRGEVYAALRLARALQRLRLAAGPQAGLTALPLLERLMLDLAGRSDFRRALRVSTGIVDALVKAVGRFDDEAMRALHRHSQLLWRSGDAAAALTTARQVQQDSAAAGAAPAIRLAAMGGLAIILADAGALDDARSIQQEVVEGRLHTDGPKSAATLRALIDLFLTLIDLKDLAAARELLSPILQARLGSFQMRNRHKDIGLLLEANVADAREHQRLLQMLETGVGPARLAWPRDTFEM